MTHMILSDVDIKLALEKGELILEPFEATHVQPASYDLRLDSHFLLVDEHRMNSIDLDNPIQYKTLDVEEIVIPPKSFVLATTMETITLGAGISGAVEGRSSIGRMGLFIQNAGWIDPGFSGQITLELFNANSVPIRLRAGRRICQIVLQRTQTPSANPYKGKYLGQKGTVGSRIYKDLEATP